MKVYIVCFKEYAHGPKIFPESKAFESKAIAAEYASQLTDDLREHKHDWDQASYYMVKEMEVIDT